MKIQLTRGCCALVSVLNWLVLRQFKWHARVSHGRPAYAARSVRIPGEKYPRLVMMHRLIVGARPGEEVDHRDGNTFNNYRRNLRKCTGTQNRRAFKTKKRGASSKYRGVVRVPFGYVASIRPNRIYIYLGFFKSEEAAARSYDKAAKHHFGKFAQLNFPNEQQ